MSRRLPPNLRKLPVTERRLRLRSALDLTDEEWEASGGPLLELADVMIESAVGVMAVPLGVAPGFLIDGAVRDLPMATEEPSVIAAATYAAAIIRGGGGFSTWADDPVMTAQVLLEGCHTDAPARVEAARERVAAELMQALPRLAARGGGFRDLDVRTLSGCGVLRVHIHVDVRDAMGANLLNTAAEAAGRLLESITGGRILMAILTNSSARRKAGARFSLDPRVLASGGVDGADVAARIVRASRVAQEDPDRAVTHNKGIMNGISALALATGNDTRGIEAAAHAWAARDGGYRGLSVYSMEAERLEGTLELPLPLATVGGGVSVHPTARMALKLLGGPSAVELGRIAAALGLAQNLAALRALVTEGIQAGHMRHHATRVAYQAGARGDELAEVAAVLGEEGVFRVERAREILAARRGAR